MTDLRSLADLSGVEQLRLGFQNDDQAAPIAKTLGFQLVEIEEGRVVFELAPGTGEGRVPRNMGSE